jgi:hypothetical protein
MGPPPRMRPVPPVRPEHAGRLPLWERLAFAVVLAIMVVFVVVLTISAARAHERRSGGPATGAAEQRGRAAGSVTPGQPTQALERGRPGRTAQASGSGGSGAASGSRGSGGSGASRGSRGSGGSGGSGTSGGSHGPRGSGGSGRSRGSGGSGGSGGSRGSRGSGGLRAERDRRLAAALGPVRQAQTGDLAVGVSDLSTGVTAVYGGRLGFHTASIVKVDILAGLLLADQRAATPLSDADADLAAQMIETSSDDAASDLWAAIGSGGGLASADVSLGLRHTTPGPGTYWGLTTTTAGDQLRLLRALTTPDSPLDARSRDYELDLMRNVISGQNWGVSAAASPGSLLTIKDGWLPDPSLWVVNSIGVVDHDGQRLLMVVLSSGQPTEASGIAQDQAAAQAAADWVTAGR